MNSGLMTVSNYLSKGTKKVPYIRLKGVWLNDYGFTVGTPLIIECSNGVLIIKVKESSVPEEKKEERG
jgi:hypothetical protein